MNDLRPLSVVALLEEVPAQQLRRGQVGTVVKLLAPGIYEVEFSDIVDETYATVPLRADQLLELQ